MSAKQLLILFVGCFLAGVGITLSIGQIRAHNHAADARAAATDTAHVAAAVAAVRTVMVHDTMIVYMRIAAAAIHDTVPVPARVLDPRTHDDTVSALVELPKIVADRARISAVCTAAMDRCAQMERAAELRFFADSVEKVRLRDQLAHHDGVSSRWWAPHVMIGYGYTLSDSASTLYARRGAFVGIGLSVWPR